MLVKPRKKIVPLEKNEIRVIQIGRQAVQELLWENLMEHQDIYFDLAPVDDSSICLMQWSETDGILTYAVMPLTYAAAGKEVNFDFLRKRIGITTSSLFRPQRYHRIHADEQVFMSETGKAGKC